MRLDPYLTPYTKVKSKWIKDLNVRPKTLKLLDKHIEQKLRSIGVVNDFFNMASKVQLTNERLDKSDFMRILKNCIKGTS